MQGQAPRDRIVIHSLSLPRPQRTLGQTDQLAVDVPPAMAQVSMRMQLVGDAVDGELVVTQEGISLTPRLDPRFAGDEISRRVTASLNGVNQIETRAQVTGTVTEPTIELESNIGSALAAGIAEQVQEAIRETQQLALLAKYREIDAMIAELDRAYEQKSRELTAQFETRRDQIERIKEIIATRVELNDGVTDEKWPLRETFRR